MIQYEYRDDGSRIKEGGIEMKSNSVYIGTYTNEGSEGIYQLSLNLEEKKMESVLLAATIENPTYLALSHSNKYLYSVAKRNTKGGVAAFSINEEKLLNDCLAEGANPCHISVNTANTMLISGNYHKGTVDAYSLNDDGSIKELTDSIQHFGNDSSSHVHCVMFSPDEKYLCVVDLGLDALFTYEISEGKLQQKHQFTTKPGNGPRHLVFHPSGNFAYLLTELSSEIITLAYDRMEGSFTEVECITTLPNEYDGESYGGAIRMSPFGKFLYATNRGHDSIVAFQTDEKSGQLTTISHTKTGGAHPRDFEINPSGQFLIIANRDTNNLVLFEIDKVTGDLVQIEASDVTISQPVCVTFLNE